MAFVPGARASTDEPARADAPAARTDRVEGQAGGLVASPFLRGVLIVLGWTSVGLGAIGTVVPGWPTTVWLLIAAFLFARSSPRFYAWLLNHRLFGPFIRDLRAGRGLPARAKAFVVTMIVLFAGSSAVGLGLVRPWLGALVGAIGLVGIVTVLRLPTRPRG